MGRACTGRVKGRALATGKGLLIQRQAKGKAELEGETHPHSGHSILASCSLGLRQREQKVW